MKKTTAKKQSSPSDFRKAYLKEKFVYFLLFLVFVSIFALSFSLYRLPLEAIWYPAVLCAVLGLIYLFFFERRAFLRHREMERCLSFPLRDIREIPEGKTAGEQDFRKLLEISINQRRESETIMTEKGQDMVEYYTTWVHQIKTPISSMRLRLESEDSPLSRSLSIDLSRIEHYTEMVLAFIRLDSDESDYMIRRQAIDPLVRQSVRKFAGEFILRGLRLEYGDENGKIDGETVTDEKWFCFVLEQLLSNALKYTRKGCIRLHLAKPGVLCIEDTGIGIAPEDLPRLFSKGYTGFNGRQDKQASGLGLYLCKTVCNRLGHELRIESVLGKGTCVYLSFSKEPRVLD